MARASTRTLLSLDRWAEILGLDPRHFNQVETAAKPSTVCGNPWKQYGWQESGQIGREDLARAIAEAEDRITEALGYPPLPTYIADERRVLPRPAIPEVFLVPGSWSGTTADLRGQAPSLKLRYGYYLEGGLEAWSVIQAGAAVVYTDADGDGYKETATIAVPLPAGLTSAAEVALVYPGESADPTPWEVRPLRNVTIAGGVITITAWRHQLPDPGLWEALSPTAIDGDDDTQFLATVDVYRHATDSSRQAQFLWSSDANACGCGSDTCATCAASAQEGCLLGKDYRLGIVHLSPATWDATLAAWQSAAYAVARQPDRCRLWYRAGYQDGRQKYPSIQMDPSLERAIAHYALTLLDEPLCGCPNLEVQVHRYCEDLALEESSPTGSRRYNLGRGTRAGLLECPFGTQRGAWEAWQRIQDGRALGRAVEL